MKISKKINLKLSKNKIFLYFFKNTFKIQK